jgi:hypothetical protein
MLPHPSTAKRWQSAILRLATCSRCVLISFFVFPQFCLLSAIQAAEDNFSKPPINVEFVMLRGNTRPEAISKNDRGRVSDALILNHMMLQLRRTPAQEQALEQRIKDIHDPSSPLFHHWIRPTEFGQRYGAAPAEVARVTDWLASQGFKVHQVYPNQMMVDFTGSAGQIRQAFRTEIHSLQVNGEAHIANMSDPQIPATMVPVVAGIVTLNDFRPQPLVRPRPNYDAGQGYDLVPADLWEIYNFNPAFTAGNSGQGQTIVVLEDSDVSSSTDWGTFRSVLSLSATYPQGSLLQVHPNTSVANNCADPGINGDDVEATLDAEWASAGAPSATIEVASCANTLPGGVSLALENLINGTDPPPAIISLSYAMWESGLGAAQNAFISSLYQQAVAEGVSIFVGAGDGGANDAEAFNPYTVSGINVNGLASTPYNVAVGGTDLADTYQGTSANYWNAANAADYGSALSYIPEIPWNDSCASVLLSDFNHTLPTFGSGGACNQSPPHSTVAGGGGPSGCATGAPSTGTADPTTVAIVGGTCAGYAKPLWQSALQGNPSDGVRDIPDVSLFAGNGTWNHSYVYCLTDPYTGTSCVGTPQTWAKGGGTSFAAPILAGVQALVNQASGTRWGNPNPVYYSLAAQEYSSGGAASCNSALGNQVATNCTFYDINQIPLLYGGSGTGGDTDVPCIGANCYLPSGTYGVLSTAPQILSTAIIVDSGSGYTSAPSCTLTGGGGTGAACSANLTGVVSSLVLTNPGAGFTSGPACTLTGGGGTGATCIVDAICGSTASACGLILSNGGGGYTSAPTCTLTGGGGAGATCAANVSPGLAVTLTAPGSGFTSLPDCILTGGGGTGATCTALADNMSSAYQPAYTAGPAWDFTSGIGTVNVSNLLIAFTSTLGNFSPSSLVFTGQTLNVASPAQVLTVTNKGTNNFAISTVTISGTNASEYAKSADTCSGATLLVNDTCTVSVTFTPTAPGTRTASLVFVDNALNTPHAVSIVGTGSGTAVSLWPTSLTFTENLGGTSFTSSVTLTNTGTDPVTISAVTIGGPNSAEFSDSPGSCSGATIMPASTCAVGVNFSPSATGSRSATLSFVDNAANNPQTVPLNGTGTAPVLGLSSASLTFAVQPVGTTSPVQGIVMTDTGTAILTIWSVTIGGPNASDFAIVPGVPSGLAFTPNTSYPFGVTFTPSAGGSRTASLIFNDNTTISPQTVPLSGTGAGPGATFSSPTLNFAPQAPEATSPAQSVTLTNTGTTNLGISAVTLGGANAGAFAKISDTCAGATLAPSQPCAVAVTFTPAAPGNNSAQLIFNDNASSSPQSVTLIGTGTGPEVTLSSPSLTFLGQLVGTSSAPQTITLTNSGTTALTISSIGVTGDFSQTNACGSALGATSSCAITIAFSPTVSGTRTGTLGVSDNGVGGPQSVGLTGTGQDFTFALPSGSSATATATRGQTATYALTVSGQGGITGTVSFACTGAPSEATCTISPNPATAGNSATNVTVSVTTTAPSGTTPFSRPQPPIRPPVFRGLWILAFVLLLVNWTVALRNRHERGRWRLAILPFVLGLQMVLTLTYCGGGGITQPSDPGTPTGTYSLTVKGTAGSGSSTVTHSVILSLKVS